MITCVPEVQTFGEPGFLRFRAADDKSSREVAPRYQTPNDASNFTVGRHTQYERVLRFEKRIASRSVSREV